MFYSDSLNYCLLYNRGIINTCKWIICGMNPQHRRGGIKSLLCHKGWSEYYMAICMTYKEYLQALLAYSSEKAEVYRRAFRTKKPRPRSAKLYTLLFEWDMAEDACTFFRNQLKINRVNMDDAMPG